MKNILLLDGYNLIYRARYSGMNKGNHSTVFNFFRGIRPLVEKFNPDIAYFVLEGTPVQRLNLDPNYKGQRVYNDKDDFNWVKLISFLQVRTGMRLGEVLLMKWKQNILHLKNNILL